MSRVLRTLVIGAVAGGLSALFIDFPADGARSVGFDSPPDVEVVNAGPRTNSPSNSAGSHRDADQPERSANSIPERPTVPTARPPVFVHKNFMEGEQFGGLERGFSEDPIDASWASPAEIGIYNRVSDNGFAFQYVDVQCRTTICRIELFSSEVLDETQRRERAAALNQKLVSPTVLAEDRLRYATTVEGKSGALLMYLYGEKHRTPTRATQAFIETLNKRRELGISPRSNE